MKKTKKFGALPPRYSFGLNPFTDARFSKCPRCKQLTHLRKFPFLIYIEEGGFLILGKTSRYCSTCEFIVVHQDELEAELAAAFSKLRPEVVGNPYLVVGTYDQKAWKAGMETPGGSEDIKKFTADFKKRVELTVERYVWAKAPPK